MNVAVRALRRRSPARSVAVPVSPPDVVIERTREADRIVCLRQPARLHAIGYYYRDFPQISDEEVIAALEDPRP